MDMVSKEVYFNEYCPKCEYEKSPDSEDPCNECLTYPSQPYSHKPMNFKEKE